MSSSPPAAPERIGCRRPGGAGRSAPASGWTEPYVSVLMETEVAAMSFWMKLSATL